MLAHDIIIRPIITEKSMQLAEDKKYTFNQGGGAHLQLHQRGLGHPRGDQGDPDGGRDL